MLVKDCCTARHAGHAQQRLQDQFHHWHLLAGVSSRDEQWVQGRQAQQGCKPLGRSWAVARLQGVMLVGEHLEDQGMTV